MTFTWNSSLQIGDPEIDRQHKQLIDQMNCLVQALQRNTAKEEVNKILRFLDLYIQQHFGHEEDCMHRHRCPVANQNKAAHAHFIKTFKEIRSDFENNGTSFLLVLKINENLLDWFINHIRKIDTELKPCLV